MCWRIVGEGGILNTIAGRTHTTRHLHHIAMVQFFSFPSPLTQILFYGVDYGLST